MNTNTPTEINQCPEFPFFGARYPDARCIDGFLWDLDSYEEGLGLTHGGEYPCPFCNTESFIEMEQDEENGGYSRKEILAGIESLREKYDGLNSQQF